MKLILAEKPSVAKTIASFLGANARRNGYFEGNGYLITYEKFLSLLSFDP